MLDLIRTEKTYKTYKTAMVKLRSALEASQVDIDSVRYLIAAHADGGFVPVVIYDPSYPNNTLDLVFSGITVIN